MVRDGIILSSSTDVNIKPNKPRKYEDMLYIKLSPSWEDEFEIIFIILYNFVFQKYLL